MEEARGQEVNPASKPGAGEGAGLSYARGVARALLLLVLSGLAWAQPVTVAAASSLGPALKALAARYQSEGGAPIRLVLASSGKLFRQIQAGAPYDLFLPASEAYARGLAYRERTTLARGVLVLYFPPHAGLKAERLDQLLRPAIRRVALANPAYAPFGRAAVAALKARGLLERLRPKLVYGESVAQAARIAAFAADAGLIDRGSAMRLAGSFAPVAEGLYPPIRYPALLLSDRPEARGFFAYLMSPAAEKALLAHGLERP